MCWKPSKPCLPTGRLPKGRLITTSTILVAGKFLRNDFFVEEKPKCTRVLTLRRSPLDNESIIVALQLGSHKIISTFSHLSHLHIFKFSNHQIFKLILHLPQTRSFYPCCHHNKQRHATTKHNRRNNAHQFCCNTTFKLTKFIA